MFGKKRAKEERYCTTANKGWDNDLTRRVLGKTFILNGEKLIDFELMITSCARGVWRSSDNGEIDNLDFFAKYWTSRYEFIPCNLFLVKKEQDRQTCGELRLTSEPGGGHDIIPELQFRLFVDSEESYFLKECIVEMALKQGRPAPIRFLVEKPEGFEVNTHMGLAHSNPLPITHYWTASYLDVETVLTPYDRQIDHFLSMFSITKNHTERPQE